MKNIAIIPARGGSKRIPRKNIRNFGGKPIIAYSIEAALKSGLFDEVMVSTDDHEIAEIAKFYGAEVPFFRSSENSNDFATIYDVISEVTERYKALGVTYEFTSCIFPTAPFVTAEKLIIAFKKLKDTNSEAVIPVLEYSYPIQRALLFENSTLKLRWPENLKGRSQDFDKCYHDSGQFYIYRTELYLKKGTTFNMNTIPFFISHMEAQDIDNETDWKLAEMKFQLFNRIKK